MLTVVVLKNYCVWSWELIINICALDCWHICPFLHSSQYVFQRNLQGQSVGIPAWHEFIFVTLTGVFNLHWLECYTLSADKLAHVKWWINYKNWGKSMCHVSRSTICSTSLILSPGSFFQMTTLLYSQTCYLYCQTLDMTLQKITIWM